MLTLFKWIIYLKFKGFRQEENFGGRNRLIHFTNRDEPSVSFSLCFIIAVWI